MSVGRAYRRWAFGVISATICAVLLVACSLSPEGNCARDADCAAHQRCAAGGGVLLRGGGVCVDKAAPVMADAADRADVEPTVDAREGDGSGLGDATDSSGLADVPEVEEDTSGDADEDAPTDAVQGDDGVNQGCADGPSQEVCDGVDNDCDGLIDEDAQGMVLARACGGACPQSAMEVCEQGAWGACEYAARELCNGVDDDCDGQVDNQSECDAVCPGGGTAVGTLVCGAGGPRCELPQDLCGDAADNDCDGEVDEGCGVGQPLDGMVFVPGGPFWMGAGTGQPGSNPDETPMHLVGLNPYYIDRREVSVAEFEACVTVGGCDLEGVACEVNAIPEFSAHPDKPVTCLTYAQMEGYCAWKNKRLPTEAEWEKAARGPYPSTSYYPWGSSSIDPSKAVYSCEAGWAACTQATDSAPDGESVYGLRNMAGNVAEVVSDYYSATYYTSDYVENPVGPEFGGEGRVARGGTFSDPPEYLRVTNRAATSFPNVGPDRVGFRCAKGVR